MGGVLGVSSGSLLPIGRFQHCRLKINSVINSLLCTEGLLNFSSPSSEDFFLQAMTYFSISFVPGQPHSLPAFLPVFKKEKCSITDTSQVKARG